MPKQLGILRRITARLSKPSSVLEPITVMLECGHVSHGMQTASRARCQQCKRETRIRQVAKRKYASTLKRKLAADTHAIFVRLEDDRARSLDRDRRAGARVYRVQVMDVTPVATTRKEQPGRVACESLVIACDAAGLEYVRAKLLEMGEALDGVVLVT